MKVEWRVRFPANYNTFGLNYCIVLEDLEHDTNHTDNLNDTFTVLLVNLQLDNPDPNLLTINLPHGKWAVHSAAFLLLWHIERRKSCGF